MSRRDYIPDESEVAQARDFQKKARRSKRSVDGDRPPPHSLPAECGVLGCVMLSPVEVLSECEERGVTAEWFYDLRHQVIWHAASHLYQAGRPIDVITLQQRLRETQELEAVGGISYLAALPDVVPSAVNLPEYLHTVRKFWTLRRMLRTCQDTTAQIYEWEGDVEGLVSQFERDALALSEDSHAKGEKNLKELLREVQAEMEEHYNRGKAQITGVATSGLEYLDKMLGGLGGANGNFIVLSGRPGSGKTSLAMQIALHAARRHVTWSKVDAPGEETESIAYRCGEDGQWWKVETGMAVGVFTLEMKDRALVKRALFEQTAVINPDNPADMQRYRTGFMVGNDLAVLAKAAGDMAKATVLVDEECFNIESLRAKARRWYRQYGCRLFVIDYLQLLSGPAAKRFENRNAELVEISKILRRLSKGLNVPFVVLAQMNRDFEKDPNRKPRLSDLKDCGAIEQDADVVMMLYQPKLREQQEATWDAAREKVFGKDADWSKGPTRVDLEIPKNRFGPTGHAELLFQKSSTHFLDYTKWLKDKGCKAVAQGESRRDLPSNEELEG